MIKLALSRKGYGVRMDIVARFNENRSSRGFFFRKGLCFASSLFPIPFVNFILGRLVRSIGEDRPEVFNRIEGHHHKWFLIDPIDLPIALCLCPDPAHPKLKAYRRHSIPKANSRIAGNFLTLLGMIDGRYDGDALFFKRDLIIEGDTEAVVCLRNALDDMDGSIADDVAAFFGMSGQRFLKIARRISERADE